MSTDIHAHVEYKIDGEWVHYSAPMIASDYRLFDKICGVRSGQYPGTRVKRRITRPLSRVPDGVSDLTRRLWYYDTVHHGAHDVCQLTQQHIGQLYRWYSNTVEYAGSIPERRLFGYFDESTLPSFVEDYQVIMWFDS